MSVRELGYLGLETADLAGWARFGTEVLGLARARHSTEDACYLKADERPHRFALRAGAKDRLAYTGWGVRDAEALDVLCERLVEAGFETTTDPGGFRVELFHSPILDHTRFMSPIGVERFVTGDLGLGHVVLLTDHYEESFDFYVRLLGFRLSDSMVLDKRPLRFLRCNPRHHSLALAPHHTSRLAHLMLEVPTIDEVGYCMDRCRTADLPVAMTLGRHTNDLMVSFYLRAPRGYEIEYGCGGLRIDEAAWSTQEITAVSFWGHHRELK
jgi:3,4-dihydroxy-9,10-secoandrosta-1,3,5(10)-triene-9,17-dione 4,5-dioxygenase